MPTRTTFPINRHSIELAKQHFTNWIAAAATTLHPRGASTASGCYYTQPIPVPCGSHLHEFTTVTVLKYSRVKVQVIDMITGGNEMAFKKRISARLDREANPGNDLCRMENDLSRKIARIFKIIKTIFTWYIACVVLFGTINFFVGHSIGGIDTGIAYTGYFLSMSWTVMLFFIPGAGIVIACYFNSFSMQMMGVLGLVHDFWLDVMVTTLVLVTGVVIQVAVIAWTVFKVIYAVRCPRVKACFDP